MGIEEKKEFLLVDGYNIIFSWKELAQLALENLYSARSKLADILCNYQGYEKMEIILVFDGHKSKGNPGSLIHYNNIDIVFTKETQTADQYIEMTSKTIGRRYQVKVATSDALEQIIISGAGALRVSARELQLDIERTNEKIREAYRSSRTFRRNSLIDNLSPEMADMLERMRLTEDSHTNK